MVGFFIILIVGAVILIVLFALYSRSRDGWSQNGWTTVGDDDLQRRFADAEREIDDAAAAEEAKRRRHESVAEAIRALKGKDEDFSLAIFEDFLYALYAEVQTARGKGTLDALAPYVAEGARRAYDAFETTAIQDVVIGSMKLAAVQAVTDPSPRIEVTVEWEANYTETLGSGAQQSWYVAERWVVTRSPDAKSRAPEATRVFGCPNCGAPLDQVQGRTCSYCKQTVDTGDFDWLVARIEVTSREARGPMLVGTTEEVGTDLPTVVAPDVQERYRALCEKDPALTWGGFCARVGLVFDTFQVAWSNQEPMRVRPYLSDNLFQFQLYWVTAYKAAGLRNITENAKIATIQLARVVSDKHYDAITVRVYASSLDYTIDGEGTLMGGSRTKERQYSEYWTLLRGASRTGAPRTDPTCPNCGAPLDINPGGLAPRALDQTGHCGHCRAKVTSGEFDWVLSRIEQDEAYG